MAKTIAGCGCTPWPVMASHETFSYFYWMKMKNLTISKPFLTLKIHWKQFLPIAIIKLSLHHHLCNWSMRLIKNLFWYQILHCTVLTSHLMRKLLINSQMVFNSYLVNLSYPLEAHPPSKLSSARLGSAVLTDNFRTFLHSASICGSSLSGSGLKGLICRRTPDASCMLIPKVCLLSSRLSSISPWDPVSLSSSWKRNKKNQLAYFWQ